MYRTNKSSSDCEARQANEKIIFQNAVIKEIKASMDIPSEVFYICLRRLAL